MGWVGDEGSAWATCVGSYTFPDASGLSSNWPCRMIPVHKVEPRHAGITTFCSQKLFPRVLNVATSLAMEYDTFTASE